VPDIIIVGGGDELPPPPQPEIESVRRSVRDSVNERNSDDIISIT